MTERETKPGLKTTEFWMSLIAMLTGIAILVVDAVGGGDGIVGTLIGGVVAILSALGYAVPRASVKKTEMLARSAKRLGEKTEDPS